MPKLCYVGIGKRVGEAATGPMSEAYWTKRMLANQNSVGRFRHARRVQQSAGQCTTESTVLTSRIFDGEDLLLTSKESSAAVKGTRVATPSLNYCERTVRTCSHYRLGWATSKTLVTAEALTIANLVPVRALGLDQHLR